MLFLYHKYLEIIMPLNLYNTLTKNKELFKSIEENHVKIYLCGPTVYDLLHVGNFRGAITFNLVRNWLEKLGYKVTFIYNYTDVDDKIIKKANTEGVESSVISERYIEEFEKDFKNLGLKKHTQNPRVTEYMPQIIEFVETLIKNEKAYAVNGEVFYAIDKFENYGKLSGKKLEDLEAGQRVEVDDKKQNPFDFVLWKPAKEGEPWWDSPWGKGRPGWHIECSAMIKSILGNTIDIHGGGIDLIFPHHENEIAQGEGCNCETYCNYWMHNEFINLKDQKMSKSLGNVITGRSFMERYHPEVLKFLMISSHYRSMLEVTDEKIHQCMGGLHRVYSALKVATDFMANNEKNESGKITKSFSEALKTADARIAKALNDDFNSGEAISHIFEIVRQFNGLNLAKKKKDPNSWVTAEEFFKWVTSYGEMMALFQEVPENFLSDINNILLKEKKISKDEVETLLNERASARANKDFAQSDIIRDKLHDMGIEFSDTPDGFTWHVKI
jgi:cysteinyl-tRNA synthetase